MFFFSYVQRAAFASRLRILLLLVELKKLFQMQCLLKVVRVEKTEIGKLKGQIGE